jgi:glyceraldehyde 3-phosphate dehydrogenase
VLPHLKGKIDGISIRVPTPNVSLVDMNVEVSRATTVEEVNEALRKAEKGSLAGILKFCDEELVSTDFNGAPESSIVDGPSTAVIDKTFVKVMSWYDNEWGYANRLVEQVIRVGNAMGGHEAPTDPLTLTFKPQQ